MAWKLALRSGWSGYGVDGAGGAWGMIWGRIDEQWIHVGDEPQRLVHGEGTSRPPGVTGAGWHRGSSSRDRM